MMDAIAQADPLEQYTATLSALVDETRIQASEDGWQSTMTDPADVAMVETRLDPAGFESFETDGVLLGVNLARLEDVVEMGEADDPIHIEFRPDSRKLHIEVNQLEYTMALIDPDSIRNKPDLPDLDLPVTATVEWARISRSITAADMVSDHIIFGYDHSEDLLYCEAAGDTDDVYHEHGADELIDATSSDDADSIFSLDYLKDINKAIPADAEVTITVGEELPMMMDWEFADGHGSATYMMAPRIRSD